MTQLLDITQGKDDIKDVQFTSATTDTLTTAALTSGGVAWNDPHFIDTYLFS